MRSLTITILSFFISSMSLAATLNVPASYSTIQLALNTATIGDTILVEPGTYSENLVWPNTADLKLFSLGDTSNTIVDASGVGRCLDMQVAMMNNTIIKGFRFTNGQSLIGSAGTGAGIKLDNGASPSIENCMVDNGIGNGDRCYGAGVFINGGTAKFINCSILQNHSISSLGNYDYGAGFHIRGSADIEMTNVNISQNETPTTSRSYGGGIYANNATLTLNNCMVNENHIKGTSWAYGSGIYIENSVLNMIGGEVNGNRISDGSRANGGGLYVEGSVATLSQVKIINQDLVTSSRGSGNGVFIDESTVDFENCLIANNSTTGGNSSWVKGGGVYSDDSDVNLVHCTVANNDRIGDSFDGPGVFFDGNGKTLNITSSIMYNPHPTAELYMAGGSLFVNYSNVRGGTPGTSNQDVVPEFIGAPDYHLQSISPCLEMADPSSLVLVDIENVIRPSSGATVSDMGCYQFCLPTSSSITEVACDSYLSPSGSYTWTSSNVYVDTILNAAGCDSVITIDLTINTVNAAVVQSDDATLEAVMVGAAYQWLDCDNSNVVIVGETAINYVPTTNGNYAVEVTVSGCTDTSACQSITNVGVDEMGNNSIAIYPNPTKNIINVNFGNIQGAVSYTITSIEGRIIEQKQNVTTNEISIDLSNEGVGVYLLKVENKTNVNVYKIVRQ